MGIVSSNKRSFFQNFYPEILTSKQINQQHIKPYYDKGCLGLVQAISDLQYNREAVWEEFSDV